MSRIITARWDSVCRKCNNPIRAGVDRVAPTHVPGYKKSKWIHVGCVNAPAAATPAAIDIVPAHVPEPAVPVIPAMEPVMESAYDQTFAYVLKLAAARLNILLIGPAGCGKTHMPEQVAAHLGLRFGHITCTAGMSEGQLLGRLIPIGEGGRFEYVMSEFVRCFEEGGVFLFDEVDAADSNTMLIINTALANGRMAVPNRPGKPYAERHPDFICIAAANTHGTGADRKYVGRNQLDEATLDRFRMGQIEMDYDAAVEAKLCPDDELRNRLQWYRKNMMAAGVRRLISTRAIRDAYKAKAAGCTDAQIDKSLFSGWTADEVSKVRTGN